MQAGPGGWEEKDIIWYLLGNCGAGLNSHRRLRGHKKEKVKV